MKKKIILFVGFLALGVFALVYLLWNANVGEVIGKFGELRAWQIAVLFLAAIVNFLVASGRWSVILRKLGYRVPLHKLFFHLLGGYGVSYITPVARAGGEPVRIFFLNQSENIPLREATSSVITDKSIDILSFICFGVVGMSAAVALDFAPPDMYYLLIGLSAFCTVFIVFFLYRLISGKGFFVYFFRLPILRKIKALRGLEDKVVDVEKQIMQFFRDDKVALFWAFLLSFISTSFFIFDYWLIASFFDVQLTITQAFVLMTMGGMAFLLPVPGGVGAFEAIQVAVGGLMGVGQPTMLAISFLIRTKDIFITFIGFAHILQGGIQGLIKTLTAGKGTAPFTSAEIFEEYSDKISHGFFGKDGGVSEGDFYSLNVKYETDDEQKNIEKNREIVKFTLQAKHLRTGRQEHTDKIITVTGNETRHEVADALVCKNKMVAVGVITADCQPILIYDPKKKVVAAVHAGWEGTVKNILGKTVKYMEKNFGCEAKNLVGAVGPSISVESYEFLEAYAKLPKKYHYAVDSEKHLDLSMIIERQWVEAGCLMKRLQNLRMCTCNSNGKYFSHRSGDKGRQISAIMLK